MNAGQELETPEIIVGTGGYDHTGLSHLAEVAELLVKRKKSQAICAQRRIWADSQSYL